MVNDFLKYCVERGAKLTPFILPNEETKGWAVCNPSVFIDPDNGNVYANLRMVNFIQLDDFEYAPINGCVGPVTYYAPDEDRRLKTENIFCELIYNEETCHYEIGNHNYIKYLPRKESNFSMIGHEDCRIVKWDGKYYIIGCRRDTRDDGQSRMEMSEIDITTGMEIRNYRIPSDNEDVHLEKNWVPILDRPYEFIKWPGTSNRVKYDIKTRRTTFVGDVDTYFYTEMPVLPFRGSSQYIHMDGYYICFVHESELSYSRYRPNNSNGSYYHRFVILDEGFDIKHVSPRFFWNDHMSDFGCGMAYNEERDTYLITFSSYDNTGSMMEVSREVIERFTKWEDDAPIVDLDYTKSNDFEKYAIDNNIESTYNYGLKLFNDEQYTRAAPYFALAAKRSKQNGVNNEYTYCSVLLYAICHSKVNPLYKDSCFSYINMMANCCQYDTNRYESYYYMAKATEELWVEPAKGMALVYYEMAMKCIDNETSIIGCPKFSITKYDVMYEYYKSIYDYGFEEKGERGLRQLYRELDCSDDRQYEICKKIRDNFKEVI